MATMALIGLRVASLSGRARGSMVLGGWGAGVGLTDGTVVRGMEMLAGVARGAIAADTTVAEAGVIAAAMPEVDTLAATPVADSMAEQFTVAEAFTAQADSTVVAAMAADTADVGKIPNG